MTFDFLSNPVTPFPREAVPDFDHGSPARFFNRELSWLAFNERVLAEVENRCHPLLERVRFLSISGKNLDEFYMVRVAGLRGLVRNGVSTTSIDGLTPSEQLVRIDARARALMDNQQSLWLSLIEALRREDIHILGGDDLNEAERSWAQECFCKRVMPILTPLAIDTAHPFPFIPNMGFSLALKLKGKSSSKKLDALVPIPRQIPRFIRLPRRAGKASRERTFISLENLILLCMNRLFPNHDVTGSGVFRVLRDSDIEIEEEAEDLVREFETALKRRRRGEVIRLAITSGTPSALRQRIAGQIAAREDEIIATGGLVGVGDLDQMIVDDRPELRWKFHHPRSPERIREHEGDIFAAIREKDILLHHPYESFETVVQFLRQAAQDPNVLAIKQTLYRTSSDSPIVSALCQAAEAGKSVTALIELKARFDEAANIRLARQLEREGVQVVFGFLDWKIHAKVSAVMRREGEAEGELVTYTHYGTGNYHPVTAEIYTDLSLFSCDPALARDAGRLFNFVTSYSEPEEMERVVIAPLALKQRLFTHIEEEIAHAKAGRKGCIWAKLNSLAEPDVIDALYRASRAGVRIDLVVRGICALRPGVPGLSDNIRVKSVIGRFLEHSRIACFGNGHGLPSRKATIYISSADWMDRNLNRRVEAMIEIRNATVRSQILDQIMAANLRDEANSWILRPDGDYVSGARKAGAKGHRLFSCHDFFMQHPSLSGRGRAGRESAPPRLVELPPIATRATKLRAAAKPCPGRSRDAAPQPPPLRSSPSRSSGA